MQACIVRIQNGRYKGWQVRVGSESFSKKYQSKMFADSRYGGSRNARKEAQSYLQEERRRLGLTGYRQEDGPRGMLFRDRPELTTRTNTSGVTGVYKSYGVRSNTPGRNVYRFWAAVYRIGPDGKPTHRQKRFIYGTNRTEKEAFSHAVEFRKGYEEALLDGGVSGVKRFFRDWKMRS